MNITMPMWRFCRNDSKQPAPEYLRKSWRQVITHPLFTNPHEEYKTPYDDEHDGREYRDDAQYGYG